MQDAGEVSDGYHTFNELYEHRTALLQALTHAHCTSGMSSRACWRSRLHYDGTMYPEMFIVGIGKLAGDQISYHIENEHWDKFSHCETLEKAPEWDGHTPQDVIWRLARL